MVNFVGSSLLDSVRIKDVTCTACGMLCDDLVVARALNSNTLSVVEHGCSRSAALLQHPPAKPSARVHGKEVDLASAIQAATALLRQAKQPLIAGLGTDVQGMRAVLRLADHIGATLDHMNSAAMLRNTLVVQQSGWQVTTLTEVRNRADLIVAIGTDIVSALPRFFERCVWVEATLFDQAPAERDIVFLGGRHDDLSFASSPDGRPAQVLPCDMEQIPELVAALRALVTGRPLPVDQVAGIAMQDLQQLAQRLREARYSVLAWSAASLDYAHAELSIANITGIVSQLNQTTRSAGLPVGGSNGDSSVNQTSVWTSGYPLPNSYARQHPDYDPWQHSSAQQLAHADAMLWISSLDPSRRPPPSDTPTIVLGHAAMKFEQEPAVYIPIGTPGVDHSGTAFRCDSVVSLPLKPLRPCPLPSLSSVILDMEAALHASGKGDAHAD